MKKLFIILTLILTGISPFLTCFYDKEQFAWQSFNAYLKNCTKSKEKETSHFCQNYADRLFQCLHEEVKRHQTQSFNISSTRCLMELDDFASTPEAKAPYTKKVSADAFTKLEAASSIFETDFKFGQVEKSIKTCTSIPEVQEMFSKHFQPKLNANNSYFVRSFANPKLPLGEFLKNTDIHRLTLLNINKQRKKNHCK